MESIWKKILEWMAVFVGTVKKIFKGTVDREVPTGPVPSPPEGNYPKLVQLSISNITRLGCTVNFELDRNGDLYWGVWEKGLSFNKNDITTGALSSDYGIESAVEEEYTSFVIDSLAQGIEYVFACYTKDANDESPIIAEIIFKTTGISDPGGVVSVYGDFYSENYG